MIYNCKKCGEEINSNDCIKKIFPDFNLESIVTGKCKYCNTTNVFVVPKSKNENQLDFWEQKYRSIGEDRNFLTGVTDEQNVYHESNITTMECKQFYHDLNTFICKRMSSKLSNRQLEVLHDFINGDVSYKSISKITEKTIQNTHKMFNKDLVNKMKREVFRDEHIKEFIKYNAPDGIKKRLLAWFYTETSEHYLKKCTECGFKMTSQEAFEKHFKECDKISPTTNPRKIKSREKHNLFLKHQKDIVKKYFRYNHYTKSNLNEFMISAEKLGFVFSEGWIRRKEFFGEPFSEGLELENS
jgi:hypothetical protein